MSYMSQKEERLRSVSATNPLLSASHTGYADMFGDLQCPGSLDTACANSEASGHRSLTQVIAWTLN